MNTIDKIRAEIERLMKEIRGYDDWTLGFESACERILNAIDIMPDEEPVSDCHGLEEAADEWCKTNNKGIALCADKKSHYLAEGIDAFIAGAEWQKKQIPMPEDTVIFQKGVEEGKRLMMEGAVEGEVVKDISNKLAATAKNINLDGLKFGDKVRIIIVKEEEQ